MILKNAYVFLPDTGFTKCDIKVEGGKISDIGNLKEDGIDCSEKFITPGLVEAHSHIGICEESIGWEGDDICELEPVTPQMMALDGINPFDVAFREALSGGVTTLCTGPGSAGVVAGTFTILENNGSLVVDNMVVVKNAAMKCAFGENPRSCFGKEGKMPNTRPGVAFLLRKTLQQAIDYREEQKEAIKNEEYFSKDLAMEMMQKVLNKEIPLKCHAHRADDICTAIRIAEEFDVLMTIDHCTEGHLIADYLAEKKYPAIVGPSFTSKSKYELKNKSFSTVPILVKKGLKVAITTDHNVIPQESLITMAAMAKKEGLSDIEAIQCVTSNPAEILGIGHLKGSLKIGLDADIVVWSGNPLDIQSKVENVYVKGVVVL